MKKCFANIPDSIPGELLLDKFKLKKLEPSVTEMDFKAVMSCKKRLRSIFSRKTDWPRDDMTLEENTADLVRHNKEFLNKEAFAFTAINYKEDTVFGCVYIDPSRISSYDCEVYFWLIDEFIDYEENLCYSLKKWLMEDWQLKKIIFPGRELTWNEWEVLLAKFNIKYENHA